jgi:Pyruvate/2-oxoacid:ferredoxin oxidoreductase delta subunit
MQGLIICYSTSGNTRLVAHRIGAAFNDRGVNIVVRDPVGQPEFNDLHSFDVVGFGTPTMAWKPSWGFFECLGLVPSQQKPIPSFVFCTSGGQPINTLRTMAQELSEKNLVVLDGLEVTAETNWPVARQFGGKAQGFVGKPDEADLVAVVPFVDRLVKRLASKNMTSKVFDFRLSPLHFIGKRTGPKELRRAMGIKRVDRGKCIQCATCARSCAPRAISLRPYPIFSNRCIGCWSCYNNCPTEAITTTVTGGRGRYKGPALKG